MNHTLTLKFKPYSIPLVGLGTWQITDEVEGRRTLRQALELGYRHFDTAQRYGNEELVGEALKESVVPRSEIFLTTKVWRDRQSPGAVLASVAESLQRLRVSYVDLLLLHFPVDEFLLTSWREMEQLLRAGQARMIGVSNYGVGHLERLLEECTVRPAVNQIELHVFWQQRELVKYCKEHTIQVEAYSPLAHGYGLENPTLKQIAQRHKKSVAQVMLRWCLQQGAVVIPKAGHRDRLAENLDLFNFTLDARELQAIAQLDRGMRALDLLKEDAA